MSKLAVLQLGSTCDVVAADSSELSLLARTPRTSMAHGVLHPGATSYAIAHRTVDEVWFVVSGRAEIWRANDDESVTVKAEAAMSFAIPCGTRFQYRTIGDEPFCFIMATTPAWPGDDEAFPVAGVWNAGRRSLS